MLLSDATPILLLYISLLRDKFYPYVGFTPTPSTHPLYGDEIRALRKLQRDYPRCPFVFQSNRKGPMSPDTISGIVVSAGRLADLPFPIHAHMLRHGTGYFLANKGVHTRTIQSYLGHNNIQHTVRYTQLAPTKFQGLWEF
ncbi:MAG: tyrosine-type recombinase/integrase [Snowella sp.]|nr:tyrosine-type recombinase/integrase [Snowella sp.]